MRFSIQCWCSITARKETELLMVPFAAAGGGDSGLLARQQVAGLLAFPSCSSHIQKHYIAT